MQAAWAGSMFLGRRADVFFAILSFFIHVMVSISPVRATAQDPASPGAGSDPDDPFAGVEEMVVVGQDVVGTLTSATTSVTAFDAMELQDLGAQDISDLARHTPNLSIVTLTGTTPTFFIRGIGLNDFGANSTGAVAIYTDGAPRNLPAIQLGLLYDTDRVEILKGPQATGANRNASAGTIHIHNTRPSGELTASGKIEYGNFDLIDVQGMLEVPVLEDFLSVRSAFRLKQRDGIVTNRCGGLTQAEIDAQGVAICNASPGAFIRPGLETDLNDIDQWSARTMVRFLPPLAGMEWLLKVGASRVDQLGTVGQPIGATSSFGSTDRANFIAPEIGAERQRIVDSLDAPTPADCRQAPDRRACLAEREAILAPVPRLLANSLAKRPLDTQPFEGEFNNPGFERQTSWEVLLDGSWELRGVSFQTITSFVRYDRERFIDADFSPNTFFEFDTVDDAWQLTQDLRISGELDAIPLGWDLGGFYLQEELDFDQETVNDQGPLEPLFQSFEQKTYSFGVFADFEWDFVDDFTLEGGFRYNWERKRFDAGIFLGSAGSGNDQCEPKSGSGLIPQCVATETFDHPTGSVALKYRFDELRSFYLKYSHGWKSAQISPRDGRVPGEIVDVASPEKIDAFEIGFDGSWLEDRVKMNGALFWYSYENFQVFTVTNDTGVPPTRIVINADDARVFGAELEATLEPIDHLVIDVRSSWIESEFLDFTNSVARPVPGSSNQIFRQVLDFNGNELPNAPRFKVSGTVRYDLHLGRYGTLIPRYDFTWTDKVFFDQSGGRGAPNVVGELFMPDLAIGQQDFWLHNFRLTWRLANESIEIAGWVRNMTNEVFKTLAFDASGGPGLVGNLVGDPRTFGLTASFKY